MSDFRPTASTVRHTLSLGQYRRLDAKDAPLLRAHLLRLHPDDRRSRFMATAPKQLVDRYVQAIGWQHALLVGCFVGRSLRGVCELYPIKGRRAEMAVSVERRFQGRGIGTGLLSRTFLLARNRGLVELEFRCLANNQPMRKLVGKFNSETSIEAMEACAIVHSLPATAATYVSEMVEQASLFGATLIRFWIDSAGRGWGSVEWPTQPDLFAASRSRAA
jgi:GNAT superfamily N-acetyltransferase